MCRTVENYNVCNVNILQQFPKPDPEHLEYMNPDSNQLESRHPYRLESRNPDPDYLESMKDYFLLIFFFSFVFIILLYVLSLSLYLSDYGR